MRATRGNGKVESVNVNGFLLDFPIESSLFPLVIVYFMREGGDSTTNPELHNKV